MTCRPVPLQPPPDRGSSQLIQRVVSSPIEALLSQQRTRPQLASIHPCPLINAVTQTLSRSACCPQLPFTLWLPLSVPLSVGRVRILNFQGRRTHAQECLYPSRWLAPRLKLTAMTPWLSCQLVISLPLVLRVLLCCLPSSTVYQLTRVLEHLPQN